MSRPSTAWQPQGHLAWLILDVTIARFRARHEQALAGFLVESLKLCAPAGRVQVGTVAVDGTKLAGNASDMAMFCGHANPAIVAAIKAQAERSTQFLLPTEASVEVAEEVARRYPVPMWSSTQFNDVDALAQALEPGDVAMVLTEPAMTNRIHLLAPEPGWHRH